MAIKNKKEIDDEIIKVVREKVEKALARGFNADYADELKERIKERTRRGSGVDPETGATLRFPKLSDDYKKVRKKYQSKLSGETTKGKSNLTATGQLLNSLTVVKVKTKGMVKYVFRLGDRRGRNLDGSSSKIGNKQLNEYVSKKRNWFGFTKSQKNQIIDDIRQMLKNFLK